MGELALKSPVTNSGAKYIKSNPVSFRPNKMDYKIYDRETKETTNVTTIKGIIVGLGLKLKKDEKSPNVKAAKWLESPVFGNEIISNRIGIPVFSKTRKATPEGPVYTKDKVRDIVFDDIKKLDTKDQLSGMKTLYIVYILDPDNLDAPVKEIEFSTTARVQIQKEGLIPVDITNYITEIGVTSEPVPVRDSEFYMPTFTKLGKWDSSILDKVKEQLDFIDAIINNKDIATLALNEPQQITIDDVQDVFENPPF